MIEVDLIDVGVEVLVVRPQGVEDGPNHLEALIVGKNQFWCYIIRNNNWNDDVAEFLALERAHDPPHALHHLNFAVSRREE